MLQHPAHSPLPHSGIDLLRHNAILPDSKGSGGEVLPVHPNRPDQHRRHLLLRAVRPPTTTSSNGSAAGINPYRQAGGILDRTTGWTQDGARYNDTTTGAFTTPDTISKLADTTDAASYPYAADNPINNIDPTGQSFPDDLAEFVDYEGTGLLVCAAGLTYADDSGIAEYSALFGPETFIATEAFACAGGAILAEAGADEALD